MTGFRIEPDHEAFVKSLYLGLLNRKPDRSGFQSHVDRLARGKVTRHQLALAFLSSPEFRATSGRDLVGPTDFRIYAGYTNEDLALFSCFDTNNVVPKPGFLTEWIGSRVRISSLWRGPEYADDRVLPLPIPGDYHCDTIEWIGVLKAVLAAKNSVSVMELGAGHGPWLAAASAAARARGITALHLCGVEADPGRFALLRQNMEDNGLLHEDVVLVQGAIGATGGHARWPRVADPVNDAGARPLRPGNADDEMYLATRTGEMIDVEIVPIGTLLRRRPIWDLVHIDIQGTEAELCRGCLTDLTAFARYLVIGTHSRKLDGDLMEIFVDGGWHLEHEKPTRLVCAPGALMSMRLNDGTQVWRNPRL